MNKKGFTLIELMIVIAIIAIIAAIAIPSLIKSKISANEGAAAGSLKTLNGMMATYKKKGYYGQGRRYPTGASIATDLNPGKFCGLYYEVNNANQPVTLIGAAEAGADVRANGDTVLGENTGIYTPVIAITTIVPQPAVAFSMRAKQGYWFALCQAMSGNLTAAYSYDLTQARNHYGLCAVPEDYGSSGENTFVINEEGTVYSRDNGDALYILNYPTVTPADLGWEIAQ